MRDPQTLGSWLRRFLIDYIVTERCLASNTQKSYRDSFKLLLPFVSDKVRKPVDRLDVEDLTPSCMLQFLAHLEEKRDCSVQTRNQRLTAIRSFARFVASRDPARVAWCSQIPPSQPRKLHRSRSPGWPRMKWKRCSRFPTDRRRRGRSNTPCCCSSTTPGRGSRKRQDWRSATSKPAGTATIMRSLPCAASATKFPNAHCGHVRRTRFANSARDAPTVIPSSSAAIANATPGSASIDLSSDVQPACQRLPHGRYHRTSSATQAPVICCRQGSISTPSVHGSGMSVWTPPTSTRKSISR